MFKNIFHKLFPQFFYQIFSTSSSRNLQGIFLDFSPEVSFWISPENFLTLFFLETHFFQNLPIVFFSVSRNFFGYFLKNLRRNSIIFSIFPFFLQQSQLFFKNYPKNFFNILSINLSRNYFRDSFNDFTKKVLEYFLEQCKIPVEMSANTINRSDSIIRSQVLALLEIVSRKWNVVRSWNFDWTQNKVGLTKCQNFSLIEHSVS